MKRRFSKTIRRDQPSGLTRTRHQSISRYLSSIRKSAWCKGNSPLQFLETRRNNHSLIILSAVRRNVQKVARKRACLGQQKQPILLHENARPHVVRVTQTKFKNLGIKVLPHPPYFPDLYPTDVHVFKHLQNFTTNRQLKNHAAVE